MPGREHHVRRDQGAGAADVAVVEDDADRVGPLTDLGLDAADDGVVLALEEDPELLDVHLVVGGHVRGAAGHQYGVLGERGAAEEQGSECGERAHGISDRRATTMMASGSAIYARSCAVFVNPCRKLVNQGVPKRRCRRAAPTAGGAVSEGTDQGSVGATSSASVQTVGSPGCSPDQRCAIQGAMQAARRPASRIWLRRVRSMAPTR